MPGVDGLEATRRIARGGCSAGTAAHRGVLVLTTFDRDDYLFEALEAGASGFLLKTRAPSSSSRPCRSIAAGDALLAADVTRRVIERAAARGATGSRSIGAGDPRARRPHRARDARCSGSSRAGSRNAEIAAALCVGEATVKTHVSKILLKLGLRDRVQAVVFAYENGVAVPGASA